MSHLQQIQGYWDARAAGFSSASLEELDTEPGQRWSRLFRATLPVAPASVLDCGTGAGFFAVLLARMGYDVTAVDYSVQMLEKAQVNLAAHSLCATLLQMDAQRLSFTDSSFDAIVTRNLLWNLETPELAYRAFFRVLKPGGVLILEDGNHYLHLHDDEYGDAHRKRAAQQAADTGNRHLRHNTDNVDFSIMERIADHLPLSRIRRPQWDCAQLVDCGFSQFRTEISYSWDLPTRFLIVSQK